MSKENKTRKEKFKNLKQKEQMNKYISKVKKYKVEAKRQKLKKRKRKMITKTNKLKQKKIILVKNFSTTYKPGNKLKNNFKLKMINNMNQKKLLRVFQNSMLQGVQFSKKLNNQTNKWKNTINNCTMLLPCTMIQKHRSSNKI